jgi:predicted permease
MTILWQNLRNACRALANQPVYSLMIVGILAVGVAGMTTIFSLFNGLYLRPFPVPNQERLVMLYETDLKAGTHSLDPAYSRFDAWRQHNQTLEGMGLCSSWMSNLTVGDTAERVSIRLATHDFLGVLGLRPVLGRYFAPEEDRPDGPKVVLLSDGLWERLFARDAAVLGRTLSLDGEPFTIIGVLPREADVGDQKDIWQPLRADAQGHHDGMGTWSMGLLKKGATVAQAREDLTRIHQGWVRQHPESEVTTLPEVVALRNVYRQQSKDLRLGTWILLAVVGFAMLTACCNVMSILLARGAARTREFALRAALGASRGRILGQVLVESLILSAVGGLLGVCLGNQALAFLLARLGNAIPTWMKFPLDLRCALFCVALTAATTVLSGLLPALHAAFPRDVHAVLQSAGTRTTVSRGHRRTLDAIVTAEVALALTLLIGAALLLRAFCQVQGIDPGCRRAGVLTYNLFLPIGPYYDENKRRAFWEEHLQRIRALPGVRQAALSDYLPMTWAPFGQFEVEGTPPTDDREAAPSVLTQTVTPDYFDTLGIALLAGRPLGIPDSQKNSEKVAVINETFARRFWPGQSPLDKRMRRPGAPEWIRVVGVARDVINSGLDQPVWPCVYLPVTSEVPFGMFAVVRTSGAPLALMPSVRETVRAVDTALPLQDIRTMSQRITDSLWLRRVISWLFGLPAAAAALMALAGLYGVISYSVSRRIQEIGIRMALGARVPDVMRMVLRQGLRLIATGLAFGVVGGYILSRLFVSLPGMLYHVSATDPATFLGVIVVLTAVALLACYVPARRAARTDPLTALRYE